MHWQKKSPGAIFTHISDYWQQVWARTSVWTMVLNTYTGLLYGGLGFLPEWLPPLSHMVAHGSQRKMTEPAQSSTTFSTLDLEIIKLQFCCFLLINWSLGQPGFRERYRPHFSESLLSKSCPNLCDPLDCSLSGSSIQGVFQARILEWATISLSWGLSQPRDWTCVSYVSCIAGGFFPIWAAREWHSQ